ncbi:MAG TPA: L-seryl-tRNA(Sec) selenium transferase [Thermoanaerobaculia bacterium]|jgi:L-seryl-tRNA(Ser) seleniumtransferase|nr:L-seryl-tRNA(Sec) selenium transferase [Thermoanaerobaculia bacterium]
MEDSTSAPDLEVESETPVEDDRRRLPSIDRLLAHPRVARLVALYGRNPVTVQARRAVEALRPLPEGDGRGISDPRAAGIEHLPEAIEAALAAEQGPRLVRVINATGIFLHTNLGRAPLPKEVAAALPALLDAACDLEFDLATGRRGQRNGRVERLLMRATGAEAAVAVNNNSAALVLVLASLAAGREVVVSRGELVEIGGSFRLPEIMAAAGARLVEVGSTNRTRLADYEAAIGPSTALLLKVFPSNFKQSGFVAAVAPQQLAALGKRLGVPVLVDEGSGLLRPRSEPQLRAHPSLAELIAADCDLCCGSGDKLMGGPQAGVLVGRRELIERCRKHPFYRALRPDRAALAALEGVLRLHLAGAPLPIDRLWPDPARHRARLEALATKLAGAGVPSEIAPAEAFLGGGSAPEAPIPGLALALPDQPEISRRLRSGPVPVVGYLREGRLLLDLRTVDPEDDAALAEAVVLAYRGAP